MAEFTLKGGEDTFILTGGDDIVVGTALTLNSEDDLFDAGDGDHDTLKLFGGGTFDLNALARYEGFEKVEVVNITTTEARLTLRDGTSSDVVTGGTGPTHTTIQGNTIVGSYQGGDGRDNVRLLDDASATTINLGNSSNSSAQYVSLHQNASVATILGGPTPPGHYRPLRQRECCEN